MPVGDYGLDAQQLTEILGLCNQQQMLLVLHALRNRHLVCVSDDQPLNWLLTAEGYHVVSSRA